jgi:NAD(P)-dependent dehydrogenase (short-subunit alcohol dehydrogenase family)
VMLRAPFLACKYALPAMIEQVKGAIVNVSSVHDAFGYPHHAAYESAKAALTNLTRQIAVEYGPHGIRANTVSPGGIVISERDEPIGTEEERRRAFLYPLRRFGQPEEIARAIAFLASDDASFVTGHALVVDGGLTAQLPDFSYVEQTYQPASNTYT